MEERGLEPELQPRDCVHGSISCPPKVTWHAYHPRPRRPPPDRGRGRCSSKAPLAATCLLADEINRATPKTSVRPASGRGDGRAAGVRSPGTTYTRAPAVLVLATLIRSSDGGTYPLQRAQLDRLYSRCSCRFHGHAEMRRISSTTSAERAVIEPGLLARRRPGPLGP